MLRSSVPEFEPVFQDELREGDGELGAFQAVSVLADWVRSRAWCQAGRRRSPAHVRRG